MQKSALKTVEPESSSESELEQFEDDENRLSDDAEFPISDDENEVEESSKKKGWASSMAKVLNSDKSGVLSKAKKVEDVAKKKEKKSYTFEVEGEEVASEKKPSEKDIKRALEKQKRRERRENKLRILNLRMKPSVGDLDRERTFKKIATRGVVQLFNAVKSQHSTLETKLQSTKLESKRDEIIRSTDNKKNFLDTLMSGPRARSEIIDKGVKKEKMDYSSGASDDDDDSDNEEVKESNWSALRDDFMTGKKVGWDKDESEDEESGKEESMESDSD